MFFNWLRIQVKQAVLGGVNDAIVELDGATHDQQIDIVPLLRGRLLAVPADSERETTPARRRGRE